MACHCFLRWACIPLTIFIVSNPSFAKQNQPISLQLIIKQFNNHTFQWRKSQIELQKMELNLAAHNTVLAGVLCFFAATISSAGGLGGGGLFLPILNTVAGFEVKKASSFSALMVTGGSVANVVYNLSIKNPKFGGKSLVDYDIALVSEPCMLLGVSVGVICNVVFPEWLITVLFAIFLAWTTFKTCKAGVLYWKIESDEVRRYDVYGKLDNGFVRDETCDGSEGDESMEEPFLGGKNESNVGVPWKKLSVLVMIWVSFLVFHVLLGEHNGQSVIQLKPCGVGYWIISAFQVPLAIAFTAWILHHKESSQDHIFNQWDIGGTSRNRASSKSIFPVMALLAGVLGGVFGIGGGMVMSPLLLQVGIPPEVTAATCSCLVLFSSSMSAIQYLMLGMEHIADALIFALSCFIASLLGVAVVQRAIAKHGRASLIVFSVSTVMALSTVLITTFGALDVWGDYINGKYMGFSLPC